MGWLMPLIFLSLSIGIGVYIVYPNEAPPPPVGDGWWGRGEKTDSKVDASVRKFEINFSNDDLKDLKSRIKNTRYFEGLEGTKFRYGFRPDYMQTIAKYWLEQYDWRTQEKELNKYDHFKTSIEGIDVHFVHVKPKLKPGQTSKPLLLVHGWPGSFYEFYKMIPMLNDGKHGGAADEFYEIIVPSIPGYAFSEAPHKTGFTTKEAARVFHKMMLRLGHTKYYIQGGDWGSAIVDHMAVVFPQHILGAHTNWALPEQGMLKRLQIMIGSYFPSLILPAVDHVKVWPAMDKLFYLLQETGYFHIQATKPDTVGHGLNDSPVGLAAYILEKFSTWTNAAWIDLDNGGLDNWKTDELLTNVMLYWMNGAITSSMRFYKENIAMFSETNRPPIKVPSGITDCPGELARTPEPWAKSHYQDLVQYTTMQSCGHFAVFEEPALMATDIRNFIHKVEKGVRP
ncbi:epoxide hydrolase 1-like isoform X1 [Amphiura filiformis]|uniref:epoxide hydrolase 1-like isoform X1 n=1 Tax=Amphiura filiformis TaxID=82378 RepID=UPI003B228DD3